MEECRVLLTVQEISSVSRHRFSRVFNHRTWQTIIRMLLVRHLVAEVECGTGLA